MVVSYIRMGPKIHGYINGSTHSFTCAWLGYLGWVGASLAVSVTDRSRNENIFRFLTSTLALVAKPNPAAAKPSTIESCPLHKFATPLPPSSGSSGHSQYNLNVPSGSSNRGSAVRYALSTKKADLGARRFSLVTWVTSPRQRHLPPLLTIAHS